MTQEEQGTQVEEAGDADDDLELDEEGRLERVLVRFDGRIGRCGQVVDYKDVGQIVHQRQEEDHHDQAEEKNVVGLANAIVQPAAVMVEAIDASITGTAVLGCIADMRLANVTLVLIFRAVKITSIYQM